MPFAVLSAFLCLGMKYDIRRLNREAQKRLYLQFPSTLVKMDALNSGKNIEPPAKDAELEFLLLARKTGLLSVLPSVLYDCCKLYTASQIIEGVGSLSFPPSDQMACLAADRAISDAQAATTYEWLYSPRLAFGCITRQRCEATLHKTLISWFTPTPKPQGFYRWNCLLWRIAHHGGLCHGCTVIARQRHEAGRAKFWEQLPGLLRLPPWAELLKYREERYVFNYLSIQLSLTMLW